MGCNQTKELTPEEIVEGLKECLMFAADRTVKDLGAAGGFWGAKREIEVPGVLGKVIDKVQDLPGIGDEAKDFHKKMNEAAEAACGSKKTIDAFRNLINKINFADAKAILNGGADAATNAFRKLLGDTLREEFEKVVKEVMGELGVISVFEKITDAYAKIPFIGEKIELDLYDHIEQAALGSLWETLAHWEAQVRNSPALRESSQVLQRVFGQNQQKK